MNRKNRNGRNTALHIAAGNVNVSGGFIEKFKSANARIQNSNHDTPFHVAAKSTNPRTIIHLLNTFAPSKSGWDIDDADRNRDQNPPLPTLLSICACSGNAEAVALLIQHGADLSKDVLRDLVFESVECPDKTEQLLAVYRVIVDNAVTWRCLEENTKLITKESRQYNECLRQTMMWLITRPDNPEWNVIRCAIKAGASEILEEILNTPNVFLFDSSDKTEIWFDVTNFAPHEVNVITANNDDQRLLPLPQPRRNYLQQYPQTYHFSYLFRLIHNGNTWHEKKVLEKEPFKGLMKPYIRLSQQFYLVLALVQLIYMICFSIHYIPTTCSLIELFNLNMSTRSCGLTADNSLSDKQSIPSNPSWLWLLWPVIMFAYTAYSLLVTILGVIVFVINILYECFKDDSKYKFKPTEVFMLFGLFNSFSFCVSVFVWNAQYGDKTNYHLYVKSASIVLLFGWIMDFFFFSKLTNKFCIFSQVLREIIVKDIAMSFLLLFLFTFVGFSFAMHTLRVSELPSDNVVYLVATVYDVFISALGAGEYFQEARDKRSEAGLHFDLYDVLVIAYLCLTAIILLNVLIAMINHRYDKAMIRAENIWRLQMLSLAFFFFEFVRQLFVKQPGPNQQGYYCCCCGIRCCFCKVEQLQKGVVYWIQEDILLSRRFLKVK